LVRWSFQTDSKLGNVPGYGPLQDNIAGQRKLSEDEACSRIFLETGVLDPPLFVLHSSRCSAPTGMPIGEYGYPPEKQVRQKPGS